MIDSETGYDNEDPRDMPDPTEDRCDQCGKQSDTLKRYAHIGYICPDCDWDNWMDATEVQSDN